jgi:hypothetical protein
MKKVILFYFLLFITNYLWSQNADYFSKKKEYHCRAIYIDKHGDTITNEKMVIKPLGHAWVAQPWSQTAVRYVYYTDTADYKDYVDPDDYFHERNKKFEKKGKMRISAKETTGGVYNNNDFYMHPPRTNQYRMLFYAEHPHVYLNKLTDSVTTYMTSLTIPSMGVFNQKNTVTPIPEMLIDGSKVKGWKIFGISIGDIKERDKLEKLYNSTLDAIFTKEYGFIKLHYTFENGIKIQFDLEKVVHL